MPPIPPSKRRRIDTASHTLSQPFKSPFKTPHKTLLSPSVTTNTATISSPTKADPRNPPPTNLSPTKPSATVPTARQQIHPAPQPPSSQYYLLQKQHTHLLNHLSHLRSSLETTTQALKIESSSRETELQALITKWKVASRAAAEEVFAKARDRVNKMGGVGAMRERERERDKGGGSWGWEGEEKARGEGEDGEKEGDGEDGAGFRGGEGESEAEGDERDEREEGAKGGNALGSGEGDEEGGYTMDMMLRTLNIELDLIGFDKGLQKWVD